MSSKRAMITGATSGIGRATAVLLAQHGYDLILTGRRNERLMELKTQIEAQNEVKVWCCSFDIRDRAACEKFFKDMSSEISIVTALINNAGLARGIAKMQDSEIVDWEEMIDTNVKGLLYLTRLTLPYMIKQGRGDIVNISSVAGRWTYPGGGVYCASKFAVRAITEGLRFDLLGTPLRVINVAPGMVETEFSEVRLGSRDAAGKVYAGMHPLTGVDIAESILWCIERPKHINIQELVIFPTDQAGIGYVHRR